MRKYLLLLTFMTGFTMFHVDAAYSNGMDGGSDKPPPVWVGNAKNGAGNAAGRVGSAAGAAGSALSSAGDLYGGLQSGVNQAVGNVNAKMQQIADRANAAVEGMLGCQDKLDMAWEKVMSWHTRSKNALLRMASGLGVMKIGFIRRFIERQIDKLDVFAVNKFEGFSLSVIQKCQVGIPAPSFNANILPDLNPQIAQMGQELSKVAAVANQVESDLGDDGDNGADNNGGGR